MVKKNVTLLPGIYKIECWGAEGGVGCSEGEKLKKGGGGAYVSGVLTIHKKLPLFIFIGGKGGDGSSSPGTKADGGFNGGGIGGADDSDDDGSGGGGGATDVRLIDGEWDDEKSLISRIMVASGGSGSVYMSYGAPGGTINGYLTKGFEANQFSITTSVSQTSGYKLGVGENGVGYDCVPASGAGGGYWGGKSSKGSCTLDQFIFVSSSGTSYISGHPDCIAVDSRGHSTDTSIHYSGIYFTNTEMKSGMETFLSPLNVEETGHSGDGAIKITLLHFLIYTKRSFFIRSFYVFIMIHILK